MPDRADMPDLVLELSQLAVTRASLDSISPQSAIAMGSYQVLPISVTFNGKLLRHGGLPLPAAVTGHRPGGPA